MLGYHLTTKRFETDDARVKEGDLKARTVLTKDERHAVVLAALTAVQPETDELTREFASLAGEAADPGLVEDILVQMAAYVGYARARRALRIGARIMALPARQDLDDLADAARYARGIQEYRLINDQALATIEAAFGDIAGDLIGATFRSFGDVFATSAQPLPIRQLATVSGLAALGGAAPQLRFHIGGALKVGVPQEKLVDAIMWVQYLAGMPAAYNALVELKGVLDEGTAPPAYAA